MTQFEARFHQVLLFVDGHVRFGETKNGALVAAAGAIVVAVLAKVINNDPIPLATLIYLLVVLIGAGAGLVIGLVSFLPQTRLPWLGELDAPDADDNPLFFGQVQKYSAESYWSLISDNLDTTAIPKIEFAYSEQIVINARIASRKFHLFKLGVWALITGILTPLGALLLHQYVKDPDMKW